MWAGLKKPPRDIEIPEGQQKWEAVSTLGQRKENIVLGPWERNHPTGAEVREEHSIT